MEDGFRIEKWKSGRFFALFQGGELIAVTVYRRGATEIMKRLQELERIIERNEHEAEDSFSRSGTDQAK